MSKFYTFALLLLIPLEGAAASPTLPEAAIGPYYEARLIKSASQILGPKADTQLKRMAESTLFMGARDANCSGVFISSTGHMVTALHCLGDFITISSSKNFVTQNVGTEKNQDGSTASLAIRRPEFQGKKIEIRHKSIIDEMEYTEATVLYAGAAFPYNFPDRKNLSALPILRTAVEDFAVLKFDQIPEGFTCSPSTFRELSPGEPVVSTGYPVHSEAPFDSIRRKFYSEGRDEAWDAFLVEIDSPENKKTRKILDLSRPFYASIGAVARSYRELSGMLGSEIDPTGYADAIHPAEKAFITTAAAGPGMSGGGVFDREGKLTAVHSMLLLFNPPEVASTDLEGMKFPRSVSAFTLPYVKGKLSERFGVEKTAEMFRCEPR